MADVLIVGAGLAGLACARSLAADGLSVQVFESADQVGGRVRTDEVEGFLLDRGFQVLLTAYPAAKDAFDYDQLKLGRFEPGALIRMDGRFVRLSDPWRRWSQAVSTLTSPAGTLGDKLRVAQLRAHVSAGSVPELFSRPETSTLQYLRDFGFSPEIIERFFRPFFAGIFLEKELRTSSRMFEFVFRMFSEGDAALPDRGMGALPQQLADALAPGSVRTTAKVAQIMGNSLTLASGERHEASAVVLAADFRAAKELLEEVPPISGKGTTCLYFAAEKAPLDEATLVLNGDGKGPVNNLCVPSLVCPTYAPAGAHLISASVVGATGRPDASLLSSVQDQLTEWFGPEARKWRHLRSDWIPEALPDLPRISSATEPIQPRPGLFLCGDYLDTPSINGALMSGRRAAASVQQQLATSSSKNG